MGPVETSWQLTRCKIDGVSENPGGEVKKILGENMIPLSPAKNQAARNLKQIWGFEILLGVNDSHQHKCWLSSNDSSWIVRSMKASDHILPREPQQNQAGIHNTYCNTLVLTLKKLLSLGESFCFLVIAWGCTYIITKYIFTQMWAGTSGQEHCD